MENRKDILSKSVKVGDVVVYNPPYYKGLVKGRVDKITPKMFTVLPETHWGKEEVTQRHLTQRVTDVVVI